MWPPGPTDEDTDLRRRPIERWCLFWYGWCREILISGINVALRRTLSRLTLNNHSEGGVHR